MPPWRRLPPKIAESGSRKECSRAASPQFSEKKALGNRALVLSTAKGTGSRLALSGRGRACGAGEGPHSSMSVFGGSLVSAKNPNGALPHPESERSEFRNPEFGPSPAAQ